MAKKKKKKKKKIEGEGPRFLQNIVNHSPKDTVLILPEMNPYFLLLCSSFLNPLKPELNPICYLLALLGAHHFLHVSRIRVKLLTLR